MEWIFGEDYGHKVYVHIGQEIGDWLLQMGSYIKKQILQTCKLVSIEKTKTPLMLDN